MENDKKSGYVAGLVCLFAAVLFGTQPVFSGLTNSTEIFGVIGIAFGLLGVGSLWKPKTIGKVVSEFLKRMSDNDGDINQVQKNTEKSIQVSTRGGDAHIMQFNYERNGSRTHTPIKIAARKEDIGKNDVREVLISIGKEKISHLLQKSKPIAIDFDDEKMKEWIDNELSGYLGDSDTQIKVEDTKKDVPTYRRIHGTFDVMTADGKITKLSYPCVIGHSIVAIERMLEERKSGTLTADIMFDTNVPLVGGKTVKMYVPYYELEKIIIEAGQQLSRFLESKLTSLV